MHHLLSHIESLKERLQMVWPPLLRQLYFDRVWTAKDLVTTNPWSWCGNTFFPQGNIESVTVRTLHANACKSSLVLIIIRSISDESLNSELATAHLRRRMDWCTERRTRFDTCWCMECGKGFRFSLEKLLLKHPLDTTLQAYVLGGIAHHALDLETC